MPMFNVACGSGEDGRWGLQAYFLGFRRAGEAQDGSAFAITPVPPHAHAAQAFMGLDGLVEMLPLAV